jgi:GT2 family glycosyltransferase
LTTKRGSDGAEAVGGRQRGSDKELLVGITYKACSPGKGNFTGAVQMAIDNAKGDAILFLDEDAVAEERWVEKYENLLNSSPNAGGISGVIYKAYIESRKVVKTYEPFYDDKPTKIYFTESRYQNT